MNRREFFKLAAATVVAAYTAPFLVEEEAVDQVIYNMNDLIAEALRKRVHEVAANIHSNNVLLKKLMVK